MCILIVKVNRYILLSIFQNTTAIPTQSIKARVTHTLVTDKIPSESYDGRFNYDFIKGT